MDKESIRLYKFYKRKYGDVLLVDVFGLDNINAEIRRVPVHRETFYCIILITGGYEEIAINGHRREVGIGDVMCSRPGEIWAWRPDTRLDGIVLIFEESFLLSFFNDRQFLDKVTCIKTNRPSPFFHLDDSLYKRLLPLMNLMKEEINNGKGKDQHILRAMLYEALMLLNRAYPLCAETPSTDFVTISRHVEEFRRYVDSDFIEHHNVAYYADKLCVTPNYLNKIVKQALGTTAKTQINRKLLEEAERLLTYTSLSIKEITNQLHFKTTSHFIRFFNTYRQKSPLQYRQAVVSPDI